MIAPGPENLENDLGYVRDVVGRAEAAGSPRSIWFLWAAISAIGFSLIDVRLQWVPKFWMVAAPAGFVISAWLGWRHARSVGQESHRQGRAHMLHWGACMVACFLLFPMMARGFLSGYSLASAILLIVALSYFLAGVHLVPPLRWVGLVMAAAYLMVIFLDAPIWTAVGLIIGGALVMTGVLTGRRRA